jgi:hypothetical protein
MVCNHAHLLSQKEESVLYPLRLFLETTCEIVIYLGKKNVGGFFLVRCKQKVTHTHTDTLTHLLALPFAEF